MGFIDSLLAWALLIVIIAFILFSLFSYILGWFYPEPDVIQEVTPEQTIEPEQYQEVRSRRRLIGISVLIATIVIMASGGINALLNQSTQ